MVYTPPFETQEGMAVLADVTEKSFICQEVYSQICNAESVVSLSAAIELFMNLADVGIVQTKYYDITVTVALEKLQLILGGYNFYAHDPDYNYELTKQQDRLKDYARGYKGIRHNCNKKGN